MHGLLVALDYRVIPVLIIQTVKAGLIAFCKSPIQALNKTVPANGFSQCRNILGYKKGELPGISFHVLLIGSRLIRIKIRVPFTL